MSVQMMPEITKDMIDFVMLWSKVATHHTIIAIEHEGKSRNIWINVNEVEGKEPNEVKSILQAKALRAFES